MSIASDAHLQIPVSAAAVCQPSSSLHKGNKAGVGVWRDTAARGGGGQLPTFVPFLVLSNHFVADLENQGPTGFKTMCHFFDEGIMNYENMIHRPREDKRHVLLRQLFCIRGIKCQFPGGIWGNWDFGGDLG